MDKLILRNRKLLSIILWGTALLFGSDTILSNISSFDPEYIYRKDFFQDYLASKAWVNGLSPYLPLPYIKNYFFPGDTTIPAIFPHPTPHPPVLIYFLNPLALLNYKTAALVWYCIELGLLGVSIVMLLKTFKQLKSSTQFLLLFLLAIASPTVQRELSIGQFGTLLLFCSTLILIGHKKSSPLLSGLGLGMALAFKFFGWPILIYYLLKKRWTTLSYCLLTFFSLYLPLLATASKTTAIYFTQILGTSSHLYAGHDQNISLLTLGRRIFIGLQSNVSQSISAPALIDMPFLATPTSVIFLLLILLATIYLAKNRALNEGTLCSFICLSCIINPIAWMHGLTVLLVVPFVLFADNALIRPNRHIAKLVLIGILILSLFSGLIYQTAVSKGLILLEFISIAGFIPDILVLILSFSLICQQPYCLNKT